MEYISTLTCVSKSAIRNASCGSPAAAVAAAFGLVLTRDAAFVDFCGGVAAFVRGAVN